jgi:Adenylate and Guanylate cyclase catalytic domain
VGVIAVSRLVQTPLFTDIVGSTARLRELGDPAWAALLARHQDVIRSVLAAHRGREVDTAGDGFLARFDAPAPAVRAAAAAVPAVAALGLELRVGLHSGEVELHGNQISGVGVHLAVRVVAEAGPGEVLVSSTVRELMAGSGIGLDENQPDGRLSQPEAPQVTASGCLMSAENGRLSCPYPLRFRGWCAAGTGPRSGDSRPARARTWPARWPRPAATERSARAARGRRGCDWPGRS